MYYFISEYVCDLVYIEICVDYSYYNIITLQLAVIVLL